MILALIAVYLATFRDWRPFLSPGEVGTVKVVATDRRQARVIHRYCRALLAQVPTLAQLIESDSVDEIALANGIAIEIATASFRTIRGFTIIAALLDELAYWPVEDCANPDQEIVDAIRPAMATVPGAMLLAASSPYARRGVLWQMFRRYYAKDDAPALIWKAPTRTMNPTVPQAIVDEAIARDPAVGGAEFLAEFRQDIEGFLSRETVDAAVDIGVTVRPPQPSVQYVGFADSSGGAVGGDSFAAAIAHVEGETIVLDCLYEKRPPFNPSSAVTEVADLCREYRVTTVTGDRYAAGFVVDAMADAGLSYVHSQRDRSAIYCDALPLFTSGRVRLLDNPRLAAQLAALERRTSPGGRDRVDHGVAGHDNLANAVCGCLVALAGGAGPARHRGIWDYYRIESERRGFIPRPGFVVPLPLLHRGIAA